MKRRKKSRRAREKAIKAKLIPRLIRLEQLRTSEAPKGKRAMYWNRRQEQLEKLFVKVGGKIDK